MPRYENSLKTDFVNALHVQSPWGVDEYNTKSFAKLHYTYKEFVMDKLRQKQEE